MRNPIILCADDEPVNLGLLEIILISDGYDVLKATSGEETLAIIESHTPDLVLLDVIMSGIDGYEVCRQIKRNNPHRNIPVIMITGLATKEARVEGIEAGAEDFITKPVDRQEVLARIKMLLHMKGLNDRLTHAYANTNNLIAFGEQLITMHNPLQFELESTIDAVANQILRRDPHEEDKPELLIIGFANKEQGWLWFLYDVQARESCRKLSNFDLALHWKNESNAPNLSFFNRPDESDPTWQMMITQVETLLKRPIRNGASCHLPNICVQAYNYSRELMIYDASLLNSLALQTLFLKSLGDRIKDTDDAFAYTVHALARAAEVNDEDTGDHILRVGAYSEVIAAQMQMPMKFIDIIKLQATMHDVGKIHIPPRS